MSSDRYLSPEPMLQSPMYVRRMAQTGMSVPTYAYGLNNPLRYVDSTGLAPGDWFPSPDAAARDAFGWIDRNQFGLSSIGEVGTNIYPIPAGVGPLEPNRPGYTYDPPVPLGGPSGGTLPPSPKACADAHNHPLGSYPSERDLRGYLSRAMGRGSAAPPYTGFVSNNRGGYWSASVTRVPMVPPAFIPSTSLPSYFGTGGGSWW